MYLRNFWKSSVLKEMVVPNHLCGCWMWGRERGIYRFFLPMPCPPNWALNLFMKILPSSLTSQIILPCCHKAIHISCMGCPSSLILLATDRNLNFEHYSHVFHLSPAFKKTLVKWPKYVGKTEDFNRDVYRVWIRAHSGKGRGRGLRLKELSHHILSHFGHVQNYL